MWVVIAASYGDHAHLRQDVLNHHRAAPKQRKAEHHKANNASIV